MTDPDYSSAYITKAQPFAQPVLRHIRQLVLAQSPEIVEAKKWSCPAFTYKGTIVCMMAGFKAHVTFGFWYGQMVTGGTAAENAAMGSFGRIASLADLPPDDELATMVANSLDLIDRGVKPPQYVSKTPAKPPATTPPALVAALAANPGASAVWDGFPPGAQREYSDWVAEAKRDETRDKRVAQAVAWIAEGKKRNWKYENC